jgi:hypothetical protein
MLPGRGAVAKRLREVTAASSADFNPLRPAAASPCGGGSCAPYARAWERTRLGEAENQRAQLRVSTECSA